MSKNEISTIKECTLDSREVAKMVEKEHKNLLADILSIWELAENFHG